MFVVAVQIRIPLQRGMRPPIVLQPTKVVNHAMEQVHKPVHSQEKCESTVATMKAIWGDYPLVKEMVAVVVESFPLNWVQLIADGCKSQAVARSPHHPFSVSLQPGLVIKVSHVRILFTQAWANAHLHSELIPFWPPALGIEEIQLLAPKDITKCLLDGYTNFWVSVTAASIFADAFAAARGVASPGAQIVFANPTFATTPMLAFVLAPVPANPTLVVAQPPQRQQHRVLPSNAHWPGSFRTLVSLTLLCMRLHKRSAQQWVPISN